jgi:tetratricopeptide (TPR) repeat protein
VFPALAVLALVTSVGASTGLPNEIEQRRAIVHNRTGEELVRGERYAEAVEEFRRAIALDPLLAIAHFNLGQASMALREYPEAVRAYLGCEEAVRRSGRLGEQERERRDRESLDEIQELRESLVKLQSGRVSFVAPVPMIVRIEDRIRFLENTRMRDRDVVRVPAEVYVGLGSAYFRQDRLDEAERAYRQAIKTNDRLGAAHNNLAVVFMMTGRFAESRAEVAAAERAGFAVDPRFKRDLVARESRGSRERR